MRRKELKWLLLPLTLLLLIIGYFLHSNELANVQLKQETVATANTYSVINSVSVNRNGEVQIMSVLPMNGTEQFEALAEQIVKDKKSQRFRVIWYEPDSGGAMSGTLVYDRQRKIIKTYDEDRFHEVHTRYEYLITQVSDGDILHFVDQYAGKSLSIGAFSFISIFSSYGCKIFRLRKLSIGDKFNDKWPDIADRVKSKR